MNYVPFIENPKNRYGFPVKRPSKRTIGFLYGGHFNKKWYKKKPLNYLRGFTI